MDDAKLRLHPHLRAQPGADAFIKSYSDQFLSDVLWSLVVVALIAPELILTTQTLWRIRSAKARHARAAVEVVSDSNSPDEPVH